jgi:acyl-CoA thioester hydrolase
MDNEPAAGMFCGREHILPLRIYYEDTDFSGVVYHANYVRYLERGRSEFIRAIGVSHSSLMQGETRVTFMVSALDMRFLRPARIDDRLEIRTRFESVRGARLIARQSVMRQSVSRGADLILEASVENICVDFQGRPRRPPAALMTRLTHYLPEPATIPANDRAAAPAMVAAE